MPDIFISEEKSLFLGKILFSSCSPTSAGFALLREAGRGKGDYRVIKNEAIRLSPDLTHSHNGKCEVTRKFFPWKVKPREGKVEGLVGSSYCGCVGEDGGAGETFPDQVPLPG